MASQTRPVDRRVTSRRTLSDATRFVIEMSTSSDALVIAGSALASVQTFRMTNVVVSGCRIFSGVVLIGELPRHSVDFVGDLFKLVFFVFFSFSFNIR
jgi:hypothetical protein